MLWPCLAYLCCAGPGDRLPALAQTAAPRNELVLPTTHQGKAPCEKRAASPTPTTINDEQDAKLAFTCHDQAGRLASPHFAEAAATYSDTRNRFRKAPDRVGSFGGRASRPPYAPTGAFTAKR